MKVQCDGCERAEAVIVCCADEAALCKECDIQVHDANKLANKHQRVPLFRPASITQCDICQEKTAYFFCQEDRALLCHNCDMSIHRSNASTSNHKRFLITGIAASLQTVSGQAATTSPGTRPSSKASQSRGKKQPKQPHRNVQSGTSEVSQLSSTSTGTAPPLSTTPATVGIQEAADFSERKTSADVEAGKETSIFEFLTEAVPGWKCDELLNMAESIEEIDFNLAFSKVEQTSLSLPFNDQFYSRSVPQMNSSLPTSTGLNKYADETLVNSRTKQQDIFLRPEPDDAFIVPDLGVHSTPELPPVVKRRKTYYSELDNMYP